MIISFAVLLFFSSITLAKVLLCAASFASVSLDLTAKLALDDVFDCALSTPSLGFVARFACVVLLSDKPFSDADALGDVMADYVDGGGRVVLTVSAFDGARAVRGRLFRDDYIPVLLDPPDNTMTTMTVDNSNPLSRNVAVIPMHFLLTNVSSAFDGDGSALIRKDVVQLNRASSPPMLVSNWKDGVPFVVYKRNVLVVNVYPIEIGAVVTQVLRNAIDFKPPFLAKGAAYDITQASAIVHAAINLSVGASPIIDTGTICSESNLFPLDNVQTTPGLIRASSMSPSSNNRSVELAIGPLRAGNNYTCVLFATNSFGTALSPYVSFATASIISPTTSSSSSSSILSSSSSSSITVSLSQTTATMTMKSSATKAIIKPSSSQQSITIGIIVAVVSVLLIVGIIVAIVLYRKKKHSTTTSTSTNNNSNNSADNRPALNKSDTLYGFEVPLQRGLRSHGATSASSATMYENSPVVASNSAVHTKIDVDDDDGDLRPSKIVAQQQRQSSITGVAGTVIHSPTSNNNIDDPYGAVPKFLIVSSDYATPHIDGDAHGYDLLNPKPPQSQTGADDNNNNDDDGYGCLPDGQGVEHPPRRSSSKSGGGDEKNATNEYSRIDSRYRKSNKRQSTKDKLDGGGRKSSTKALKRKASSKTAIEQQPPSTTNDSTNNTKESNSILIEYLTE